MEHVVITIARQYGSGGRTVGKMLAKDLGISCYGSNLLKMASEESGISEQLFCQLDEKLKNSPFLRLSTDIYTGDLIPPESSDFVSAKNLFNYQAKVIKRLAKEESCVIIGRAAYFKRLQKCSQCFCPRVRGIQSGESNGTKQHDRS